MPVLGKWWLHATWQVLSILILISGFGIGIWLANSMDRLFNNAHTVFGIVLVVLFLTALPMLGWAQHVYFRTYRRRGWVCSIWKSIYISCIIYAMFANAQFVQAGFIHLWLGRVLIVLGVVNGGLGIKLAKQDHDTGDKKQGYTIVAAVMGALYIAIVVITALLKRRRAREEVKRDSVSERARVWI
jgi:hypothetical protein